MPDFHIGQNRFINQFNIFYNMKFDENLAALHGYLCADGYVTRNLPHQKHKYYSAGLRNTNNVLLKDFQQRFKACFSVKPRLKPYERCHIYSKELYEKLMVHGPYHSRNWTLPEMKKKYLKFWLRAFFDCEGWVTSRKGQDRRIAAESVNHQQLHAISTSLEEKFKINSAIYKRKNKDISGIHIYGKDNLLRFNKKIGFLHPDKKEKLNEAIRSYKDYDWIFPKNVNETKSFVKTLLLEKAKVKRPHTIRIISIKGKNLKTLQIELKRLFSIDAKIYGRTNGLGNTYHELAIYKQACVDKLKKERCLAKSQLNKLNKS